MNRESKRELLEQLEELTAFAEGLYDLAEGEPDKVRTSWIRGHREIIAAIRSSIEAEARDKARPWNPRECGFTITEDSETILQGEMSDAGVWRVWFLKSKSLGDFAMSHSDGGSCKNCRWPNHYDGLQLMRLLGIPQTQRGETVNAEEAIEEVKGLTRWEPVADFIRSQAARIAELESELARFQSGTIYADDKLRIWELEDKLRWRSCKDEPPTKEDSYLTRQGNTISTKVTFYTNTKGGQGVWWYDIATEREPDEWRPID